MAQQLRALATLPAPTCSSQLSVTQVPVDHTDIHVGQTPNICIYVCMYVCVYIYVCVCVYIYIYIYICMYICVCVYTHICRKRLE